MPQAKPLGRYVDGFVLPVPKTRLKEYLAFARKMSKIWKEHGALEYRETVGDDLIHKGMIDLPFTMMVKAKKNEVVIFSWVVYKSRAHRDSVNRKVMSDARLAKMQGANGVAFDMKRMAYGGFRVAIAA